MFHKKKMNINLKKEVYEANLALPENGLVTGTSGNVSAIDRQKNIIYIKPSGVSYEKLKKKNIVGVSLKGKVIEGDLNPSVDLPHHLYLYKHMPEIGSVIHTHSTYATAFAMVGSSIPVYSTAHADIFGKEIPCAPYVDNQGNHISKIILKYRRPGCPAVLLGKHGVFIFEETVAKAIKSAIMLEYIAKTTKEALELARILNKPLRVFSKKEAKKWYNRHHGGCYGQKGKGDKRI